MSSTPDMPSPPPAAERALTWRIPVISAALWLPAFAAAAPEWAGGTYYDYGWFVPPALWLFLWRRHAETAATPAERIPAGRVWWAAWLLLLPWFLLLRVLGHTDPTWRLPMLLAAFTAVAATHTLWALTRGRRFSLDHVWITLLCLSAIPWPTVWETRWVQLLTDAVVAVTVDLFHWCGKPVVAVGDLLVLDGRTVEVTDGCSGIRSLQSFLMATWFFAEWQRLRPAAAAILLVASLLAAVGINAARSFALAWAGFHHSAETFQQRHDQLGLLAFAVAALGFYLLSGKLGGLERRATKRAVRRHVRREPGAESPPSNP